jgi:hypothetical protein
MGSTQTKASFNYTLHTSIDTDDSYATSIHYSYLSLYHVLVRWERERESSWLSLNPSRTHFTQKIRLISDDWQQLQCAISFIATDP